MTSSRRHTVIVSDVHLTQSHPRDASDPLWMLYRTSEFHPDADFEQLVDTLLAEIPSSDELELVFNGDVFDFDAPVVVNETSTFDEHPLDDAGCSAQMERILDDHPGWVRATAKVLTRGGRVLVFSGNHDLELFWPGVRAVMKRVFSDATLALRPELERAAIEQRVIFRTWFHVTENRIFIEHGSQYDMINTVPDPMSPLIRDGSRIRPVAGKLAFKRTGSRMGYFNPYCEDTFYMGLFGYLGQFFKYYLLSRRRHIVRVWATGAISTVLDILRHREKPSAALPERSVAAAAAETGVVPDRIQATHALRTPSAELRILTILRELWLDRVGLFGAAMGMTLATLMFAGIKAGGGVAGLLSGSFFLYEILTPKPDVRTYDSAPPTVEALFDIHQVKAICMGHTHRPFGVWTDGRFRGNSGAWCPAFFDRECTKPVLDGRPFLWLTSTEDALSGGLFWFRSGEIVPDAEGASKS